MDTSRIEFLPFEPRKSDYLAPADKARIRLLAWRALSGFETLSPEEAMHGAICDLMDLLLHAADDAPAVALVSRIETKLRDETLFGDAWKLDSRDTKVPVLGDNQGLKAVVDDVPAKGQVAL